MAQNAPSPLYSLLDLAPILEGQAPAQSFAHMLALAQLAERCGYHRFWLAEHHNIPSVASAATAVLIGHVAGGTKTIRVGSGGIMLPNHAPLVIAEQFGTLASLYPGRIDLGLGRAPGGDGRTARALRRGLDGSSDRFPQDVLELQQYFAVPKTDADPHRVRAIPGEGLEVPLYLLGSSDFSAQLAAQLGLPFGFASHFAPDYLHVALDRYRRQFRPSDQLQRPHVIVGVNVVVADTDDQADRLFTSLQQQFLNLVRGRPGPIPPPVQRLEGTEVELAQMRRMTRCAAVGSPATVRQELMGLLAETRADELILTAAVFDPVARQHSFELAAAVMGQIAKGDA